MAYLKARSKSSKMYRKSNRPLKRKLYKKKAYSTGGFYIRRRVPAIGLAGSTTVPSLMSSSNSTVFSLGTPVATTNGSPNMFDVPFSMTFYLNQLDTASDITNIADKYRIVNAWVRLCTQNIGSTGFSMPWVEYVRDADDNSVPSISQLTQKMGVRTTGFNQRGQLSFKVKPLPAPAVYNGVSNGYIVPRKSPYINTTYDGVPHYGIKGIIRNVLLNGASSAANIQVDVQLTVHAKDLQ
jgi:hypothetical protein